MQTSGDFFRLQQFMFCELSFTLFIYFMVCITDSGVSPRQDSTENMTESNQSSFVHTNFQVFYRIAKESYSAMNEFTNMNRKPKPNGEPGYIITLDPEQKSFKHALITIVFCCMFLDSILHLLIVKQKGLDTFKEYDWKKYEDKLRLLGCDVQSIFNLCKRLRDARREIVHEKAHINADSMRIAQDEADVAIELIDKIVAYFKLEKG